MPIYGTDDNRLLGAPDQPPPDPYLAQNNLLGASSGGIQPGAAPPSGADYGPTDQGFSGLSPGRSSGLSLASAAAPGGFGMVGSLGNAFNGGVQSAQLSNLAGQMQGSAPMTTGQQLGAFGRGAFGMGMDADAFGQNAIALGFGPDDAAMALANFAATGNMNQASQAQAPVGPAFQAQGGGVANMASDVAVNAPSAAAFGASIAGTPSLAQGADGVNAAAGDMASGFGGMASGDQATANSNSEGSQGGSGSNGDSQGGGANGGGGGGGGDAYARGGVVGPNHDFSGGSGLIHGEGLIQGASGGRADALHTRVPVGGYVVPADVVSGLGDGNTQAGGEALAKVMPKVGHIVDAPKAAAKLSAGEFFIHPSHVAALGGGSLARGAAKLDALIAAVRENGGMPMEGPK